MSAPLRIDAKKGDSFTEFIGRIVKLAPAEVVVLYTTVKGFDFFDVSYLGYWSLICVVLALLSRIFTTDKQWVAIIISTIAFVLWVFMLGDPILAFTLDKTISTMIVAAYTFIVPLVWKG
ncbi:MAG TPA: hypothetical protein DCK95_12425 [Anaerolineaceae bacterium]|nr:hypothetical protein [Anaerolineaceae bacterium]